jgi:hypothetical protein
LIVRGDYILILAHKRTRSSKILVYRFDFVDEELFEITMTPLKPIDAGAWGSSDFLPVDFSLK